MDQRKTMLQQMRRNQASCASWKKKFCSLRVLHNAAHKTIDLLQWKLAQSKDECERWSSRNRTGRQRKQSTKVTRDNVLVVAPVKCQQVNRDFAALEDQLEVLKESLDGKSYNPWVHQASYQLQNIGVSQNSRSNTVCLHSKRNYLLMPSSALSYSKYPHQRNEVIVTPASHWSCQPGHQLDVKVWWNHKITRPYGRSEIATKDGPLGITQQVGGTASAYVRSITKPSVA